MKKIIFLILMVSFSFGIDGNSLYSFGYNSHLLETKKLNKDEAEIYKEGMETGAYIGYSLGVFNLIKEMGFICPPKNINSMQILDITYKYLKDHPEERNLKAETLIIKSTISIWPCPKNNSK